MAVQSKKNKPKVKSKSTTKKKPTTKKCTVKSRRGKSKKKSSMQKNIFILLILFMMAAFMVFGYLFQTEQADNSLVERKAETGYTTKQLLDDLSQIKTKKLTIPHQSKKVSSEIEEKMFKEKNIVNTLFEERGEEKVYKEANKESLKSKNTHLAYRSKKPKLVIIIDDVHTKKQLNAILALNMNITPSIFPPYTLSPKSNLLAKETAHYMIHLPMESGSKQFNKQTKTLMTSFSEQEIIARVKELRQLFPDAKYINNHTGSTFTKDYEAMKILYKILKDNGFVFIDSYTIAASKVKKIAHEFSDAYVRRDIFIDNTHTIPYIHQQLVLAVKKAKQNGYAIAIGHPHNVTMMALKSAKDILKDVELGYIESIYQKEE